MPGNPTAASRVFHLIQCYNSHVVSQCHRHLGKKMSDSKLLEKKSKQEPKTPAPGVSLARAGWIALALVVFASWRPGRLVGGAFLFGAVTILQLQAQAAGITIPPQLLSSLPYLACIVVLVLISRTRGAAGSAAPASLGQVFVPDR